MNKDYFEDYWLLKGQFQTQQRSENALEFEKRIAEQAWDACVDQMKINREGEIKETSMTEAMEKFENLVKLDKIKRGERKSEKDNLNPPIDPDYEKYKYKKWPLGDKY